MVQVIKENIARGSVQKITPFRWFDTRAEEAVKFYLSVFKNSKITRITRYGKEGPGPEGTVMTVEFLLDGQQFVALNGGPVFTFSQAISFVVNCRTQKEIDACGERLSAGGEQQPCGWMKDQYGVSWQIVPVILADMLSDPEPEKSGRVMKEMLQMGRLDIKILQRAYAGT